MNSQCTRSQSTPTRIAYRPIAKRFVFLFPSRVLNDIHGPYVIQSDEAYQVGKGMTPVAAYLAQDEIIKVALEHGVDMIHPGYAIPATYSLYNLIPPLDMVSYPKMLYLRVRLSRPV